VSSNIIYNILKFILTLAVIVAVVGMAMKKEEAEGVEPGVNKRKMGKSLLSIASWVSESPRTNAKVIDSW
jgi:hypothetical protein